MMVEAVLLARTTLGEGPVWTRDRLWFVDIKQQHVHAYDPASGAAKRWDAPAPVGWVLPEQGGAMIAGLKTGLARFSPASGTFEPLFDPEPGQSGNRLNDAATDCHGRIWFGSMDDDERRNSGALYRYANGACSECGIVHVAVTNGPAVTADARTLFHTDTLGKTIWRAPIQDDGSLGTPVAHIAIEPGAGHPDGSVIDAEGCLWVALFGGWGVRRYDPAGALMQAVRFPVANVTKIAFGGPDLRIAYATTARVGLDAAALAEQPQAGAVFAFEPGVAGLAVHEAGRIA